MLGERAARVALLGPAGLLAVWMAQAWPVTVDDAYISLRHARHWAELGTLSFDASQRIEAYSNFAAVALAAAELRAGVDPVRAAKGLGALCALGSLVLAFAIARRAGAAPHFALLGAALVGASTGMGFWAVSGLETALFGFALSAGVWLLMAPGRAAPALCCAALGLASLTRIEAPALVGAAIAARLAVRRRDGLDARSLAREHAWVAVLAAVYGAYFLWRWHYYGHFLPSPIYFKRIGGAGDVLASSSASFVRHSFPLLLAAAAAPWLASRRSWIPVAACAAGLAVYASARELVLEDVSTMAWFDRYFVPLLPCLAAAAAAALSGAADRIGASPPRRAGVALAGLVLIAWQLAQPAANPLRLIARTRSYPDAVAARGERSAAYLEQRFGAPGRVVAGDVGLLGYRFSGTVWDLYGLASYDRTLRHGGALEPHLRELLARQPDAVVLCYGERAGGVPAPCQHAERALAAQPDFTAHYEAAAEFGREEVPSAYHVVFERR